MDGLKEVCDCSQKKEEVCDDIESLEEMINVERYQKYTLKIRPQKIYHKLSVLIKKTCSTENCSWQNNLINRCIYVSFSLYN